MQKHILIAATAALLSLPLALHAADGKKKGPFMAADTDGDGKVSKAEYVAAVKGKQDTAAAESKFAALDTNKDGSLTREEFNAGAGKKGGENKGGGKRKKTEN